MDTEDALGEPKLQAMLSAGATRGDQPWPLSDLQNHWLQQSPSAPDMRCPKGEILGRVTSLVQLLTAAGSVRLDSPISNGGSEAWAGKCWRDYQGALKVLGVAEQAGGELRATSAGVTFAETQDRVGLGALLVSRVRYMGEVLQLVGTGTSTIKEVHQELVESFRLDWRSDGNTRMRMTWLEILGLVEWSDAYHLVVTVDGQRVLDTTQLVSPDAIKFQTQTGTVEIPAPPEAIEALLDRLRRNPLAMDERTTYNIWVPSPANEPSKITNMSVVVAAALTPIDKEEFLGFIAQRFHLKRSSVDSMLPFLRAGGFVQEVRKGVYVATPAARAWLDSGESVDFIRVLHCHLRFVGELVKAVAEGAQRAEVYRTSARFGMNKEKCRWIISFLIDAGLVIETSYTGLEATSHGRALMTSLPLEEAPIAESEAQNPTSASGGVGLQDPRAASDGSPIDELADELLTASTDPMAGGQPAGAAFEHCVERAFEMLGFDARRIGGSGDSDVVVQWRDLEGALQIASVDAKSSSSGAISHTHVSDVALTAHAEKNGASFIAIVAPGFTGHTLSDIARTKGWNLLTARELVEILRSGVALGLRPSEIGVLFESTEGAVQLGELIEERQRELEIVSLVVARLRGESANDEAVSARDISLIERRSDLAPSIDELISALTTLKSLGSGSVLVETPSTEAKHETYVIGDVAATANRLRALANALEIGLAGPLA